jgi:hypothetical protein
MAIQQSVRRESFKQLKIKMFLRGSNRNVSLNIRQSIVACGHADTHANGVGL